MILTIPWPHSDLNPNRIVHHYVRAKLKSKYKADCYIIAKAASMDHQITDTGKIGLDILFHAPDRRSRDLDNLLASLKSGLDGIALAFGVNDKRFRPIKLDFADSIFFGGKVEMNFYFETPLTTNHESRIFV